LIASSNIKKGDLIKLGFLYGVVVREPYHHSEWKDISSSGVYSTYFDILIPENGKTIQVNLSLGKYKKLTGLL